MFPLFSIALVVVLGSDFLRKKWKPNDTDTYRVDRDRNILQQIYFYLKDFFNPLSDKKLREARKHQEASNRSNVYNNSSYVPPQPSTRTPDSKTSTETDTAPTTYGKPKPKMGISLLEAEKHKETGNAFLKEAKYEDAAKEYSKYGYVNLHRKKY